MATQVLLPLIASLMFPVGIWLAVRRNTQLVESANGAIHQTTFAYQQVFSIDLQRQARRAGD